MITYVLSMILDFYELMSWPANIMYSYSLAIICNDLQYV